jgi:putative iron-regulated protein
MLARTPPIRSIVLLLGLALGCGDDGGDDSGGSTEDSTAASTTTSGASATEGSTTDLSASGTGTTGTDVVPPSPDEVTPIAQNYAELVFASYSDTVAQAQALQTAITTFTGNPTETNLTAARMAWLTARDPYGQGESFRFYDGPIDNEMNGPEGRINAWPLDEAYVDYVEGFPDAGIINDPMTTLDASTLADLNEAGGEENVATGYHAIEFLLWGQDMDPMGPGARPATDFEDMGTAANQDRRRLYLETVAQMLVDDLQSVADAWDPAVAGNYRESFLALPPEEVVQNIMRGIGALSGAELAEERMGVALATKLQEDEQSCFSDNTHNDILNNFLAVKHVYLGDYGTIEGPGIDTLVEARDPALAAEIAERLDSIQTAIESLDPPFDQIILSDNDDPQRAIAEGIVSDLQDLSDLFVQAAAQMGVTLNTALE